MNNRENELRVAIEKARENGFSNGEIMEALIDGIKYMTLKNTTKSSNKNEEDRLIKIGKVLRELGVSANLEVIQYAYVVEAIDIAVVNEEFSINDACILIAKRQNTSSNEVRNAIQKAREIVCRYSNVRSYVKYFGKNSGNYEKSEKSDEQFIILIAKSIKT